MTINYQEDIDQIVACIAQDRDEYDMHLSDMVFEEVDSYVANRPVSDALEMLQEAENEPGEWQHLVGDSHDWRDAIRVMAFSAVEQDVYFALRDAGVEE